MTDKDYTKVPTDEKTAQQEAVLQYGYGYRHVQALLMVLSLTVGYVARAHLGVTIVAMTSPEPTHTEAMETKANNTLVDNTTFVNNASYKLSQDEGTMINVYDWPKSTQEMVLGAFFLGYGTMMFPTGMVCQRWGGKLPLQVALLVNGIVSLLTPWLTIWVSPKSY
ncbi:PREDICTED: sialin-like [Papilio polytes]|uniref:sialin-like n=1 Tax=Papilio polytes TaxID=76194 RepID=UPI000675DF29|nr:PREDICTED: sialin-like [Papilio polytes]